MNIPAYIAMGVCVVDGLFSMWAGRDVATFFAAAMICVAISGIRARS